MCTMTLSKFEARLKTQESNTEERNPRQQIAVFFQKHSLEKNH